MSLEKILTDRKPSREANLLGSTRAVSSAHECPRSRLRMPRRWCYEHPCDKGNVKCMRTKLGTVRASVEAFTGIERQLSVGHNSQLVVQEFRWDSKEALRRHRAQCLTHVGWSVLSKWRFNSVTGTIMHVSNMTKQEPCWWLDAKMVHWYGPQPFKFDRALVMQFGKLKLAFARTC